jgi:hypothetical protein
VKTILTLRLLPGSGRGIGDRENWFRIVFKIVVHVIALFIFGAQS